MKIAPLIFAIEKHNRNTKSHAKIKPLLVHTGQHYDVKMSEAFSATWTSLNRTSTLKWGLVHTPSRPQKSWSF